MKNIHLGFYIQLVMVDRQTDNGALLSGYE
jgi:hypothetical protein